MATLYEEGAISLLPLEDYINRTILFLEYLDPAIAVQRLIGRAPAEDTLFCNWQTSWWKIRDRILAEMESRDTRQGSRFTYLSGLDYDGRGDENRGE
jgi:hypothetical protein